MGMMQVVGIEADQKADTALHADQKQIIARILALLPDSKIEALLVLSTVTGIACRFFDEMG